jgi:hypothetical protein
MAPTIGGFGRALMGDWRPGQPDGRVIFPIQSPWLSLVVPTALLLVAGFMACTDSANATEDAQGLAKKLANPIADLISVPFQGNTNQGLGPDGDGHQFYVNVEPVIPIHLNSDWNIISRTIAPIVGQDDGVAGTGSQVGIGNVQQSFFLSPSLPKDGVLWGAGPILYLPASDRLLGPKEWGAGLTGVLVAQKGPWTAGLLAHQLWPLADTSANGVINQTYLQPFLAYTTKDAWTFTLNSESTYQWLGGDWSVPLNLQVAKLVRIGDLPVSIFAGARYWTVSPERTGPAGWGARFGVSLLFPTGRP